MSGGEAVGEGTGGEAHELKQGAHDEEEEPMYWNKNTRTHTHTQGFCVCVCVKGNGGGVMSVL